MGGGTFGHDCPAPPQSAGLRAEPQICWEVTSKEGRGQEEKLGLEVRGCNTASVRGPLPRQPHCFFFPPHAENGRRLHACQYSASPTPPPVLAASEAHRDKVRISALYLTINTYNNRASRLTCKLGDLQLGRAVVTTDFCIIWILPVSYCNQRQTATLMMVNKRNDG